MEAVVREAMAKDVGRRIATFRGEAGLTSDELASGVGTTRQTVSGWENGRALPDAFYLPTIASLLGQSIDTIFGLAPARDSRSADAETELLFPSLRAQWDAFRADLRPALLKLAEALEQDSPEAQALRRAIGEP